MKAGSTLWLEDRTRMSGRDDGCVTHPNMRTTTATVVSEVFVVIASSSWPVVLQGGDEKAFLFTITAGTERAQQPEALEMTVKVEERHFVAWRSISSSLFMIYSILSFPFATIATSFPPISLALDAFASIFSALQSKFHRITQMQLKLKQKLLLTYRLVGHLEKRCCAVIRSMLAEQPITQNGMTQVGRSVGRWWSLVRRQRQVAAFIIWTKALRRIDEGITVLHYRLIHQALATPRLTGVISQMVYSSCLKCDQVESRWKEGVAVGEANPDWSIDCRVSGSPSMATWSFTHTRQKVDVGDAVVAVAVVAVASDSSCSASTSSATLSVGVNFSEIHPFPLEKDVSSPRSKAEKNFGLPNGGGNFEFVCQVCCLCCREGDVETLE
uniref:Uncharacterized protein n=1 Tax=Echinococcus canadensis TaxID=519352 RepID=A0A915F0E4_9CEST